MDKVLISVGGFGLIIFIYWFFFGKKKDEVIAGNSVDIIVDGGYKPQVIRLKKGKKTKLTLLRKDSNSCLEEFVLPDFKVKKYLPLNQKITIEITPDKKGEFGFHCGMNMFHGKVIVE